MPHAHAPSHSPESDEPQLARAYDEIARLKQTLESNWAIWVAVGIVMERYGVSHDAAVAYLARASQTSSRELSAVAAEMINSTSRAT